MRRYMLFFALLLAIGIMETKLFGVHDTRESRRTHPASAPTRTP